MSRYMKSILAVIAVCLVYLCLRDVPLWPRAEAAPQVVGQIRTRGIVLVDAQGRERALLVMQLNGTPKFMLSDARNKLRLVIELTQDGSPNIAMLSATEQVVWKAGEP